MNQKPLPDSKGVYRDGKLLVIREGARFPQKCAVCNGEDDVELVDFYFERRKVHGVEARAVTSVLTAASDLVGGASYTGPVQAAIPLCAWHQKRRLLRGGIGVGLAALAIAVLGIQRALGIEIVPPGELGFLDIAIYNFVAFGAIFVAFYLVCTTIFDHQQLWFRPRKYYDRFVWVSGAGAEVLKELPQYENQHKRSKIKDAERQHDGSRVESRHPTAEELIRRANLADDE